jgi:hypothetical protein
VRLPTTIVALISILLMYALARRLGATRAAAATGSLLLALTPAHFMHGRLACDYLFPVPFVLGWLILLVDAQRLQSPWRFFGAGALLGLGLYTYIASVMMMPVYLLLTYVVLFASGIRRARPYALVTAGFILPVIPLALYLLSMPEVYAGFVGRYAKATVNVDVVQHPLALFSARLVDEWWPTYRSFFEPRFLFEHAETHLLSSTYTTGIFMKAMQFLLPLGVFHIARNRRTPFTLLLLAVFFSAPLAASMIPEKYAIDRALMLIASGAIIATFGVDWLLLPRARFLRWPATAVCVGLLAWTIVQFNDFYRDYLTDYPKRAAFWFDGNHPGAFAPLVDQHAKDDPRFIYMSARLPRIKDHWQLYLLRRDRAELLKRTVFFSEHDLQLAFVKPGSLLLTGSDDSVERAFRQLPAVRPVAQITEPDGTPSFTIFERTDWAGVYRFDGSYSVDVNVGCSSADGRPACDSAAVPTPCLQVISVTNGLLSDNCGYLEPAALTDDGRYDGAETNFGIPITGIFDTNGNAELTGTGVARNNRYDFRFTLTKRR